MSQEIIYTSAPAGLRPGSFGFCTVATTPGMASSLAERLESLSGYRHAYPPGHPRAGYNPVVFSHVVLKVGGRRYHVLSRVADAGVDYSQRTNKLAHHVALTPSELPAGGPAWVLAQPGFAETAFSGAPRILPTGRAAPAGDLAPQVCRTWERATGDAGWAGVLANHALESKRPAYVIFPEGLDVLALVVEAQSLLPVAKRWETSFSTYFTRLPAGVDCLWRFVLAGSPEANAAARLRGETVIDLTQRIGLASHGPLVEAARTGQISVEMPVAAGVASAGGLPAADSGPVSAEQSPVAGKIPDDEDEIRLAPPPLRLRRALTALPESVNDGALPPHERSGGSWLVISLAAAVFILLLCTSITGFALYFRERSRPRAEPIGNETKNPAQESPEANPDTEPKPQDTAALEGASQSLADQPAAENSSRSSGENSAETRDAKSSGSVNNHHSPPEDKTSHGAKGEAGSSPTRDPAARTANDGSAQPPEPTNRRPEPANIGPIAAEPVQSESNREYCLARFSTEEAPLFSLLGGAGPNFSLELQQAASAQPRQWIIKVIPDLIAVDPFEIARLQYSADGGSHALRFAWIGKAQRPHSLRLMYSQLVFVVDKEKRYLQLAEPVSLSPLTWPSDDDLPSAAYNIISAVDRDEIGIELVHMHFPAESVPATQWVDKQTGVSRTHDYALQASTGSLGLLLKLTLENKDNTHRVISTLLKEGPGQSAHPINKELVEKLRTRRVKIDDWESERAKLEAEIKELQGKGEQGRSARENNELEDKKKKKKELCEQIQLEMAGEPLLRDPQRGRILEDLKGRIDKKPPLEIHYRIIRIPQGADESPPIEIAVCREG